MKLLYTARDSMEAHFLKNLLDAEGVRAAVLGENLGAARGELLLTSGTLPAVWVAPEDWDIAGKVVQEFQNRSRPAVGPRSRGFDMVIDSTQLPVTEASWICPQCHEKIEPQFTDCWKCGATRLSPSPGTPGEGWGEGQTSVLMWRRDGGQTHTTDSLAIEEPLEIRVRGRAISITMRTPGHDDELAAGFLVTEGLVRNPSDILKIEPCQRTESGNIVNVVLDPMVSVDFEKLTRHVFASSSCGLCGKTSIDSIRSQFPPIDSDLTISADAIESMPKLMRQEQETFSRTGGLHAAAIFDARGNLVVLREDVGRHNAVDKVIGHAILNPRSPGFPYDAHVLLVSGRASFEIMQKALAARIPVVAAVSAPSSLAVQFAQDSSQTLIGFLREGRMNIYAGEERVQFT